MSSVAAHLDQEKLAVLSAGLGEVKASELSKDQILRVLHRNNLARFMLAMPY
jgi:hypothetical protein